MNVKKASNFIPKQLQSPKALYVALFAIVLIAGGFYWYDQSQGTYVPPELYESRDRAAGISARIVQLTDASVITLGQISAADQKGDYKRGLQLVQEEIDRNAAIKEEAIKLSEELKVMALNLGAVKPRKATEVGLQAATTGLGLTERLITYNDLSQELLAALQERLKKNGSPETRQRIEQIILRMNEGAAVINDLNKEYQDQMREFDRLTGR